MLKIQYSLIKSKNAITPHLLFVSNVDERKDERIEFHFPEIEKGVLNIGKNSFTIATHSAIMHPDDIPEGTQDISVIADGQRITASRLKKDIEGLYPLPPEYGDYRNILAYIKELEERISNSEARVSHAEEAILGKKLFDFPA